MVLGLMFSLCDMPASNTLADIDGEELATKCAATTRPKVIHFTEHATGEPITFKHTRHDEKVVPPITHEVFNASVRQHHVRRLRNSTKASISSCREVGGPRSDDRSRLVMSLHNVNNNITGMLERLRNLHEGPQADGDVEQYAAVDFIMMPETKVTTKSVLKAKDAISKIMGSTDVEFAIARHGHDMARHGNGAAFVQAFIADCRAWRVRTNLSCVATHIKNVRSLTQPGHAVWKGYKPTTNRLRLDAMGEQPSSFSGEGDDSWYNDTESEDGRWVEIIGWLHGEEYPHTLVGRTLRHV